MQAVPGRTYFELFGLPERFDIDAAELASRYRELQRRFHPDRFAAASESDRRRSVQMTAEINAAYQALRDPVARGRYLLELRGVAMHADTDTRMEPAFLMQQMELREALAETRAVADRSARLARLQRQVEELMEQKVAALRRHLAAGGGDGNAAARNAVREMQFLQKLTREIEELE